MEQQREAINGYTYLPEAIRTQMQASLDRQMQLMQLPTQDFSDDSSGQGDTNPAQAADGARPTEITQAPTTILRPDSQPTPPTVAATPPAATPNGARTSGGPNHTTGK